MLLVHFLNLCQAQVCPFPSVKKIDESCTKDKIKTFPKEKNHSFFDLKYYRNENSVLLD